MTHARRKPAFTLVEVLVSIGVIAVLIAILVPAVGGAWTRSRELASAVNLRSIGQMFEMYVGRADGLYPAPVEGRLYPSYEPGTQSTMPHWQASHDWPGLFADTHPWWEYEGLYLAPGAQRDLTGPVVTLPRPSFEYSSSFLGDPSIWTDRAIGEDDWARLERGVVQPMVVFPSGKAMLWDVEMPYLRRPLEHDASGTLLEKTPVLFADGHVSTHIPAEATRAVPNRAVYAQHEKEQLHNTANGVRGRDY